MMWGNQADIDASLAAMPRADSVPPPDIFEADWWRARARNIPLFYNEAVSTGLTSSRERMLGDAYNAVLFELNQDQPAERRFANPYIVQGMQQDPETQAAIVMSAGAAETPDQIEDKIWAAMDDARQRNPGRYANLPKSKADLYEQVYGRAREAMDKADQARSESGSIGSTIDALAGGAPAMFQDPVNLLSAGLGGAGANSYLRFFLQETGAGALGTALTLPEVANWRRELSRPMSGAEAVGDVIGGGLATGVLSTGGRALARNFVTPAWRAARSAIDDIRQNDDVPPNARAAAGVVDDELGRAEDNPYGMTPAGEAAHVAALARATAAIDDDAPSAVPNLSNDVVRAADPQVQAAQHSEGYTVQAFKPGELQTDAAMMQYKRGGDEAGVTERLAGVKDWNPAFAGQVLVYETRDGRRIVADGHQRLGLAKRLEAEGQDVTLYGVTLREADGVTPEQARTLAALKNIAEGSGDSLDAAAVLRIAPENVDRLPPRSPLVRRARDLVRLSSDAWGMVWNGVASERDAAIVGRLVDDPRLHAVILDYVKKAQAETAEEAELIVRQALAAGARQEVQTDMFGAMLKTDLILPERVRILKAALTSLRKDRGLFKTLTDREAAIKAEGNVLVSDANQRALERAGRLFETITALAERKGPISDALQAAAVTSRETGNRRAAIKQFVEDVRGRVERGELDGDVARGEVGAVGPAPESVGRTIESQQPGGGRAVEFADPQGKPQAFDKQRADLAMELGGEAMHAPQPEGAAPKPEALQELALFDAFDPKEQVPAIDGSGDSISIGDLRAKLEGEAKAVERLRACATGEAP